MSLFNFPRRCFCLLRIIPFGWNTLPLGFFLRQSQKSVPPQVPAIWKGEILRWRCWRTRRGLVLRRRRRRRRRWRRWRRWWRRRREPACPSCQYQFILPHPFLLSGLMCDFCQILHKRNIGFLFKSQSLLFLDKEMRCVFWCVCLVSFLWERGPWGRLLNLYKDFFIIWFCIFPLTGPADLYVVFPAFLNPSCQPSTGCQLRLKVTQSDSLQFGSNPIISTSKYVPFSSPLRQILYPQNSPKSETNPKTALYRRPLWLYQNPFRLHKIAEIVTNTPKFV